MLENSRELRQRASHFVDIAQAIIASQGLQGVSARNIAAQAGCSVGTIYNEFKNIDLLILEANSRILHKLEDHLLLTVKEVSGKSPSDRLVALALSYLQFVIDNRKPWSALFEHQMPDNEAIPEWHLREHFFLFRHIVEPLSEISADKSDSALLMLARSIYSAVHGIVSLGLQNRMTVVPPEILREQLTIVVRAFVCGYVAEQSVK